jgi:hypothetical protein
MSVTARDRRTSALSKLKKALINLCATSVELCVSVVDSV